MWRSFFCALMATFTLAVWSGFILAETLLTHSLDHQPVPHREACPFPSHLQQGLALLRDIFFRHSWNLWGARLRRFWRTNLMSNWKGLYGAFVVNFNIQVAAFRRKHLANHAVAEAVALAIITAMIGYFNRFLRIDMTTSMATLFRECEGGGNVNNLCQ